MEGKCLQSKVYDCKGRKTDRPAYNSTTRQSVTLTTPAQEDATDRLTAGSAGLRSILRLPPPYPLLGVGAPRDEEKTGAQTTRP